MPFNPPYKWLTTGQITLATGVAGKIPATPDPGRRLLIITVFDTTNHIFVGPTSGVDTTSSPIQAGKVREFALRANQDLYGYQASGGNVVVGYEEYG